jgi:hypothetical protein
MSLIPGGAGLFIGKALTVIPDQVRADSDIFGIRAIIEIQSFPRCSENLGINLSWNSLHTCRNVISYRLRPSREYLSFG